MNAHQRRIARRRFNGRNSCFSLMVEDVRLAIVRAFYLPAPMLSAGPRLGDSWATETERLSTPVSVVTES